eukprot:gnl/TRDRNA2_/TRDRNA2_193747_c0_seq1.p1 gnl/TRDRNA2_/TRDRNA2_193747_c0~~gnl/TRDRNA2_/TRDRNA2_193747_c0_seq1.p1  ORF type:complete len:151 (-),score=67.87 gnl/TRDRNA2_/TRDRNA2_193747_c0_seq1:36-488(-)
MSDSGSDVDGEEATAGRGKIIQRHKRELKELREQERVEGKKFMSFAESKRVGQKQQVRAEKREMENKYKKLTEELLKKHEQELAALASTGSADDAATAAATAAEESQQCTDAMQALDVSTGDSKKAKLKSQKEQRAALEKQLREEMAAGK